MLILIEKKYQRKRKMNIFSKKSALDMINAIIIDDEPHMRHTIRKMLNSLCPDVKILSEAGSVAEGVAAIKNLHPDLIFLDIKMDDGTGFDLLKQMKPIDFKVIFITAWENFAIKAFKFSALDYLLKPIDPDDLVQSVQKARQTIQSDFNTQLENLNEHLHDQDKTNKKIIIRTAENIHLVKVKDIVFCESDGNYTTVNLVDEARIIVSSTLREYEDLLLEYGFFRVHKSYLINLRFISRFEKAEGGMIVLETGVKIPVASRKREQLLEMFNRMAEGS